MTARDDLADNIPAPEVSPEMRRKALRLVASRSHSAQDARELIAMLGLEDA